MNKTIAIGALLLAGTAYAGSPHEHHHSMQEVDAASAPSVSVSITPDSMAGWNVQLKTKRFRFAPEHVGGKDVAGEGHAHLYVDGTKVARLYGPWFHLPAQSSGKHTLRVTLNANSHGELAVNGKPIEATAEFGP